MSGMAVTRKLSRVASLERWCLELPAGKEAVVRHFMHSAFPSSSSYEFAFEDRLHSSLTDLTTPASWYPPARALQRRIVAHLGPTNSGKTHAALELLKRGGTGVYCGPLRLLAWEVAERLIQRGVGCSLITGQERREVEGAQHVACTVEMASLSRVVDVGVVDEIQMVADRSRGWAFTRALLGLPARTLHVCGDPAALPLLRRLCEEAGDELEVRQYQRLSPLLPSTRALVSLDRVGRGDCVVAFSRREVHSIRQQIEKQGRHKCCVVYGALPPEARSQQAVLFNQARTGYNVLAASDAVGMGLNLNIRRVVFTSLTKFDGISQRPLTPAEVKQIAGRAGRYGSRFPIGRATTLHPKDLPDLHAALAQPPNPLEAAGIFPSFTQLAQFASRHPRARLHDVLDLFAERALLGPHFFFAHFEDMRTLAVMIKALPLSLVEAYTFCLSPCDPSDPPAASHLLNWATVYSRRQGPVTLSHVYHPPLALARSEADLQQLESTHTIYDLFCWLAFRFEGAFEGREEAAAARAVCGKLIDESIRSMGALSGGGRARVSAARSRALREVLAAADVANAAATLVETSPHGRGSGGGGSKASGSQMGEEPGARQGRRSKQSMAGWARGGYSSESEAGSDERWEGGEGEEGDWWEAEWRARKGAYAKRRR